MNLNNYLTDLHTTTLNLTTDLAYGYGDLATTEINNLRDLLSKAEEMIPVIETEACMAEAEELDREDRSFNYWMTMLYGKGDDISPMDSHRSNKANRLKRRKANKKHKKSDRYHGKKLMVMKYKEDHEIKEGLSWLYRDCHCPVSDDIKYSMNAVKARELDYASDFTEKGELIHEIDYLENRISIWEKDIEDLEYEKAFGYLTNHGEEFLEDYKKELEELKDYKEYILRVIRTATR